ncbi:single-stranded DNA-binding protein [Intrasporangium sp.]|uniref:single-stranded DNA-binding protein n=1 Tax=Intrasporangium sp. TaxID=1925024 RepID=UPI002939DD0A|nr:single-stranded DNA-binding protein [Intrasporangium sp.]MDV3220833.1 single-stranded DNA-binding protein [Intrasporangium sp.]
MNETRVTVHGNVVGEPVERSGRNGSVFTTFRVGTTPYRKTAEGRYLDGETSFYSVIAFNALAANAASSLKKGQPVIVEGNLSNRSYVGSDGVTRNSPEIEADHIGHDLRWGRASFLRMSKAAALGLDRAADPDVRDAVAAQLSESADLTASRPAHVDADGVVHDGPVPEPVPGEVPGETPDEVLVGDPGRDDYTVEEPAA